jgi:uridylate kinase
MAQLKENIEGRDLAFSVGGSVLYEHRNLQQRFKEVWNLLFNDKIVSIDFSRKMVHGLIGMCREIVDRGNDIFLVAGGGRLARVAMADARSYGQPPYRNGVSKKQLDYVGKDASAMNASRLKAAFEAASVPVVWNSEERWGSKDTLNAGVYVRGGTRPGHTTDMVTLQVAQAEGIDYVINIGNTPGLYPKAANKRGFDPKGSIIEEIAISDYLAMFPGERKPGDNFIFEREAAEFAIKNGITVVLVGSDFENIGKMMAGEEFVGTILRPE